MPLFSNILLGLHFLDRFLGVVVVAAYCSLTLAVNDDTGRGASGLRLWDTSRSCALALVKDG